MPFQFRKEAIEEDLNSNFPSQGQGNPPLYYSLSEVVVPTYSINNVAEGTSLAENLQTAWDFSTGTATQSTSGSTTIISNPGFWKVQLNVMMDFDNAIVSAAISDGLTSKQIWKLVAPPLSGQGGVEDSSDLVVFLRSGDSLSITTNTSNAKLSAFYRQIADVNGTLVNPLGFSFA